MKRDNSFPSTIYYIGIGLSLFLSLAVEFFFLMNPGIPTFVVFIFLTVTILLPQIASCAILKSVYVKKNLNELKDAYREECRKEPAFLVTVKQDIPDCDEGELERMLDTVETRAVLIRPVLDELCKSITQSLSSTTEPISDELLWIKRTIAEFLNGMKQYEGEVVGHATLQKLENESKGFKTDMEALSETVRGVFDTLDVQFKQLKIVADRIAEVAMNISNVSANIHVLSINASIEAARTGEAGKGFRVIASEVKVLSGKTEKHLNEINDTMVQTRDIFQKIGKCLSDNKARMIEVVDNRQNRFNDYASILDGYFGKFESLYAEVDKVIVSLSKGIDAISPVIQLHEITSQEIGNLQLVADDFIVSLIHDEKKENLESEMREHATHIASGVRKRVTTEREILALKRGLASKVSDLDFNFAINSNNIELF